MVIRWKDSVLKQAITQLYLKNFKVWLDIYLESGKYLSTSQIPISHENSLKDQIGSPNSKVTKHPLCG